MGTEQWLLDTNKIRTVEDVLKMVIDAGGADISTMLGDWQKKSRETVRIMVNGKEISLLNGLQTELHNGDEVIMFPLVGGG